MKRITVALLTLAWTGVALGQIDVGSDGSDGAFAPVANTVVDLSLADTGPGTGHYDSDRWAVVFNYTSVDIPGGVVVSFINHPSGAPVVWLVDGDVLIDGGVNLDGEHETAAAARPAIPGPGGFRGGRALLSAESLGSGGYGPGGQTMSLRWLIPWETAVATARSAPVALTVRTRHTAMSRSFR